MQNSAIVPTKKPKIEAGLSSGGGLMPKDFDSLWRFSNVLSASGLMPTGIQKAEAVFVAIQMGLEVGLSPMAAVQNIAVVNGRPSIWGDSVLGLVRASSQLESFKEEFVGTFGQDDYKAVCIAKRKNDPEKIVREFSIADAKGADLWKYPNKGVTPWHKYPKRMLQMRARSWALRDGFGDILKGLRMAEEVLDYDVDLTATSSGSFEASVPEPAKIADADTSEFDKLLSGEVDVLPDPDVEKFVSETAQANETTPEAVKLSAVKDWKSFWTAFKSWFDTNPQTEKIPQKADHEHNTTGTEKPQETRPANWWDYMDDKGAYVHWVFRGRGSKKAEFDHVVRIGFGLSTASDSSQQPGFDKILEDNPKAFGTLRGATKEAKEAVKNKYIRIFNQNQFEQLLSEANGTATDQESAPETNSSPEYGELMRLKGMFPEAYAEAIRRHGEPLSPTDCMERMKQINRILDEG